MIWLKLLLALITIGFCVLLGYVAAGKYRLRKLFYTQFSLFHDRYLNELSYYRKPLPDFLKSYEYQGDFQKTVDAFLKTREVQVQYPYLKKEEQQFIKEYFNMLGKGDARSQNGYFSQQSGQLNEKKTKSEKEAKTYGELYLKLGLLAGLAFVILII